jgi:hypothetical protein
MELDDEPTTEVDGVFDGLTRENRRRLRRILSEQLPEVFVLDRIIEMKTGYTSEICRTMKIDVLAHLGTLARDQNDFDAEQQASQLAKIEEHLRRAIVEHPEEVLRDRIGDIEELWSEYQRDAYSYREENKLAGVPRHRELEDLRHRIDLHLEAARRAKPEETTWDESLDASAQVTAGADLAAELANKLEQCIGAARRVHQNEQRESRERSERTRENRGTKWRWAIGLVVTIALTVGGYFVGKGDAASTTPHARSHHPGAPTSFPSGP